MGRKQGLISNPRGHGEFVRLTDEGLSRAEALVGELFGTKRIRWIAPMTSLGGRPVVRCFLPDGYLWPNSAVCLPERIIPPTRRPSSAQDH